MSKPMAPAELERVRHLRAYRDCLAWLDQSLGTLTSDDMFRESIQDERDRVHSRIEMLETI